jgi:hypothetical protein
VGEGQVEKREAAVRLSVEGYQQRRLGPFACRRDAGNHTSSDTVSVRTSDFGCMSRDVAGGSSRALSYSQR